MLLPPAQPAAGSWKLWTDIASSIPHVPCNHTALSLAIPSKLQGSSRTIRPLCPFFSRLAESLTWTHHSMTFPPLPNLSGRINFANRCLFLPRPNSTPLGSPVSGLHPRASVPLHTKRKASTPRTPSQLQFPSFNPLCRSAQFGAWGVNSLETELHLER